MENLPNILVKVKDPLGQPLPTDAIHVRIEEDSEGVFLIEITLDLPQVKS